MIRKAKPKDFPEVFELHKSMVLKLIELNSERFELKKDEQQKFKKYFDKHLSAPSRCLLVYETEGKIVGYGSAMIEKSVNFEKYDKHGWVSEISVHKDFQNKGIGRKIMQAINKFFKEKGITAVYFLVETNNIQSVKAWEKMGFEKEIYMFYKKLD